MTKKRKIDPVKLRAEEVEKFVLDDYESDPDKHPSNKSSGYNYSPETLALLKKVGMGPEQTKSQDEEEEMEDELKVIRRPPLCI